jgi:ribosomal protein S18 acetylase RimI-like enzyme
MQVDCRRWIESDLPSIHNLLLETWLDAYASFIPEGDLVSYHMATYNIPALTRMFNEPGMNGFVAEADRRLVGYVRTRIAQDEKRFYVPSLYILPHFQGMGIGGKLMQMAVDEAVANRYDRMWIGIMEKNKEGLDWYRRFDYRIVEEGPFTMGKTTVNHYIGYVLVKAFSPERLEHV